MATAATACKLMGIDPRKIPHLKLCSKGGLGTLDFRKIAVDPTDYKKYVKKLAPPPKSISLTYRDVTVHDSDSCSACTSTVLLFLQRYADYLIDYRLSDDRFHIALGKAVVDAPDGTCFVGNCTAMHRGKGVWVKGCPPVASAIMEALVKPGKQ